MKRIIRLTESDLTRIVKRVIKENNKTLLKEGTGATAAKKLYDALSGNFFSDNEAEALKATLMINNCNDLMEFAKEVRRLTKMSVPQYVDSEMSSADVEYDKMSKHFYKLANACMAQGKYGGDMTFKEGPDSWNNFIRWVSGRSKAPKVER